jgi:Domain of unknown function (DUF4158)
LGFAVLLKFFEAEHRFPSDRGDVPAEVIGFLASQIGVEYSAIVNYASSPLRSRFTFTITSSSVFTGVLVLTPICSIHACTP